MKSSQQINQNVVNKEIPMESLAKVITIDDSYGILEPYATLSSDHRTLTFYYDREKNKRREDVLGLEPTKDFKACDSSDRLHLTIRYPAAKHPSS